MNNSDYKKKKTFAPIVLFQQNQSEPDNSFRSIIERHRQKTQEMMEQNARMWEDEGCSLGNITTTTNTNTTTTTTKPPFSDDATHIPHYVTSETHNRLFEHAIASSSTEMSKKPKVPKGSPYQFRRLFAPVSSSSSSVIEILEPQSHTPTLEMQYHADMLHPPIDHSSDLNNEVLHTNDQSNISTTFITEPQFHHTYRPQFTRKRRRGNLPKEVTELLKRWLILHKKHPYPTENEKQELADETRLTVSQISNWFINARRRILQPLLDSEYQESPSDHCELDTDHVVSRNTDQHMFDNNDNRSNYAHPMPILQDQQMSEANEDARSSSSWSHRGRTRLPSMQVLEKDADLLHPKYDSP